MRYLLVALLVVHGALHLLGLQWGRATGVLWALTAATLVTTAGLLLFRRESWWVVGAGALLLSQMLIISHWTTARAGTVVNLLMAVPILMGAAHAHFHRESDAAVGRLLARVPGQAPAAVTPAELAPLPAPVRRWLQGSGVVGKERAQIVRLDQRGWLRTGPDKEWMPATARQYFTVDEPGFVWTVSVTMKGVPVVGRDTYEGGHGRMLIKAAGLVTVVDGRGPKIDQGTLLRFLGEICWFPSAALAPYIRWEAVDDRSARATITHAGITASGLFTFDDGGRVLRLTADRYMGSGEGATLERWEVPSHAWRVLGGVTMPVQGTVTWKLKTGDFDYYRWEITAVDYNLAALAAPPPLAAAPRKAVAGGTGTAPLATAGFGKSSPRP